MTTGQGRSQDVVMPPAMAAIFVVVTVDPGAEAEVRDVLADIAGITRSVGFRAPEGELSCVVGVGAAVWDRLYGGPRPAGLHPFPGFGGRRHNAVATPGDLLIHLRSRRMDLCFELARQLMDRLAGSVAVADEVHGFRYFDERDLLGFVDGTENPVNGDAVAAVTVGDEDPAFAGGQVVGRTELDDMELSDQPSNSHVALNTIVDAEGNEREIVRDNMPFGAVGSAEFGTYFIGYASNPDVIEEMLRNMFIGKPPGNYDRILDFSTAVTGSLYYVPTADFLEDPPTPAPAAERAPVSGSSDIGSLKTDSDRV